jgi:tetratricopeptide (TPR) repeat protein
MGADILIRNGYIDPQGDIVYGNAAGVDGASRFIDVAALPNDSYACFDRVRGRIFVYDFQGNMLYAFGGMGNREGYFQLPTALAASGDYLYALDSRSAALTRFDFTDYGMLINGAMKDYKEGRYAESAAKWEMVLKVNGNYDQAYIGIGRAALQQGDYAKAMEYFKLKRDAVGYGKAFQFYRKEWVENNIVIIVLILAIIIILPLLVMRIRRFIWEVKTA